MSALLSARTLLLTTLVGCSGPRSEPNAHEGGPWSAQAPPANATSEAPASLLPSTRGVAIAAPNAAAAQKAGPPRAGCEGLFDPPEGAQKLCDEHTLAADAEIHWTSWAVTSSRLDTFGPYRARAGACGAGATFKPPQLSIGKGNERLSIHDVKESGYPSCAAKPGGAHASVVIISVKHDR